MPLALSVDVEDWPQSTFDRSLPITTRALDNFKRMLDIFTQTNSKGTFFVLGKFAEKFPEAVKLLDEYGHEIGSHGYGHVEIFTLTPEAFREDLLLSKKILEDITSKPCVGHRAPDFSITAASIWALDILAECGFVYDSSIFPVANPRYGIKKWPLKTKNIRLKNDRSIVEMPLTAIPFLGYNLPYSGGGYFRLSPKFMIYPILKKLVKDDEPLPVYTHPYEMDPDEFKNIPQKVPFKLKLTQNTGRKNTHIWLRQLLEKFDNRTYISLVENNTYESVDINDIALQ